MRIVGSSSDSSRHASLPATRSFDLLEGAYSCIGASMLYLNRLEEAEHWMKKAISEHRYFRGPNFFVALTLFGLANLRIKQMRWAEAESLVRASLEQRLSVLGPGTRLVGVTYHNLGFILDKRKDTEGAARALRLVIDVFRVPAQSHPGLLQRSMLKLASVLDKRGSVSEAAELPRQLVETSKADPRIGSIPIDSEKAWNSFVSVLYRCV